MIYGIGTDIVSLGRIARLHDKLGRAFAERILHPDEMAQWANSRRPENFLAKRFAAKEAFAKAVGTGIRGAVSFQNIGIGHDDLGRPEYFYSPALAQWLAQQGIGRVHVSISDEKEHVIAFAVAQHAV